ncbi:MAG TPA: hypothetical protein DCM59_08915 [Clostridium sp.]|nr:hypothetical protein [Clostridium sp.]
MKKQCSIEINGEEIKFIKENIKHLKKDKNFYCTYDDNKNSRIEIKEILRKSNLNVIIEGEEIFLHRMIVPKMNKGRMNLFVKNKVVEIFHHIENIIFDYEVINVERREIEIVMYCINIKDSLFMNEEVFSGSTIKSVIPIQQLYINKYKKKIKNREFTMIIYRNKYVYIVEIKNNTLVRNKVINEVKEDSNLEILEFLKAANNEEDKKGLYIITGNKGENIKIANLYEIKKSFSANFN